MEKTINIEKHLKSHRFGLLRLEEDHGTIIKEQGTKDLIKELVKVCEASGLTYIEIQKALIMVDESLYHHSRG